MTEPPRPLATPLQTWAPTPLSDLVRPGCGAHTPLSAWLLPNCLHVLSVCWLGCVDVVGTAGTGCNGVTITGVLGESNRLTDNERAQMIESAGSYADLLIDARLPAGNLHNY